MRYITYGIKLMINAFFFPIVILGCILARFWPKKYDIGIGPVPLINNVYFKKALELKGYSVETYVNDLYFITKEFDKLYDKKHKKLFAYMPTIFFLWTAFRYKIVYLYFDGGVLACLLGYRKIEALMYKCAGTKIVVMPYGSDCQLFDRTRNKLTAHMLCQDYPNFFRRNYKLTWQNVYVWSRYADIVIGTMDSIDYMYYWNRIRQCHFAIDTDKIKPVYNKPTQKMRILHAPNHKGIKGTSSIEKAVADLIEEGYDIEYIFKQGIENDEFIKVIQSADIVIDQLILGWHGMFALEAMAAGKPTICYMRDDLINLYEGAGCIDINEIPLISAHVTNIKSKLRELLAKKEEWNEIGKRSRAYVEKYHSLDSVGDFFDEINRSVGIEGRK